jgi:hypothetical protein
MKYLNVLGSRGRSSEFDPGMKIFVKYMFGKYPYGTILRLAHISTYGYTSIHFPYLYTSGNH